MNNKDYTADEEKIQVSIDKDLEDLIPGYIENRHKDIKSIEAALDSGDYETIRILGHSMKGSGGGYGFDEITTIGMNLEKTAKEKNADEIKNWLEKLLYYIQNIDITYA